MTAVLEFLVLLLPAATGLLTHEWLLASILPGLCVLRWLRDTKYCLRWDGTVEVMADEW